MTVSYHLPFPPSVNDMYLNNLGRRGKGRVLSPDYRAWRESAGYILNPQKHLGQEVASCRVFVDILIDDKRQGDCDNRIKPVLDCLVSHGILRGDSKKYVEGVSIRWAPMTEAPCIAQVRCSDG